MRKFCGCTTGVMLAKLPGGAYQVIARTGPAAAQYQDEKYGPGVRVHSLCDDGKKKRCSVCGTVTDK